MKNRESKALIALHIFVLLLSFSGVFSKLAAGQKFLSPKFIVFYGCEIVILGIYALGWQQVIKYLPMTTAGANKSVGMVWTILWGLILFDEKLTPGKIIGALLVLGGSVLFASDDKKNQQAANDSSAEQIKEQRHEE